MGLYAHPAQVWTALYWEFAVQYTGWIVTRLLRPFAALARA
jgi:hypothetical protein